jgi:hypothetical protein
VEDAQDFNTASPLMKYKMKMEHNIEKLINYYDYQLFFKALWPKKDFDGDYCKLAEEELRSMKLLSDYHKVNFAKAEIAGTGFPNPTVESASFVDTARSLINSLNITNLDLTGTMSEKGLFYLTEILEHSFKVANAKLVQNAQITA